MPATSKAQQRLFGWVHAVQKGEAKNAPASIRRIAKSISKSDAKHFAETKHKGLPERKGKKHKDDGERKVAYVLPRLVKQAGIGYTLDSSKENKMTSQKFVKVASYVLEKRAYLRKQACKNAVASVFTEAHAEMEKKAAPFKAILGLLGRAGETLLPKLKSLKGVATNFGKTVAGSGARKAEAALGTHMGELAKAKDAFMTSGRKVLDARKSINSLTSAIEHGGIDAQRGASNLSALVRKAPSAAAKAEKELAGMASEMSRTTGAMGNLARKGGNPAELARLREVLAGQRARLAELQSLVKSRGMTPELQAEIDSARKALQSTIANNKSLVAQQQGIRSTLGGLEAAARDARGARDALAAQTGGYQKAVEDAVRKMWLARAGLGGAVATASLPFALSTYSPKAGSQFSNVPYSPVPYRFGR